MNTEARMQPDTFEQLRSMLEDQSWSHALLAEYVTELAQNNNEEEIFRRMAFRAISPDAYKALKPDEQAQLRQLWHDMLRREAYSYHDLRERLSWRYMI